MSQTEEFQRLIDVAMDSFPEVTVPPPTQLHDRLRRRRMKVRIGSLAGVCAITAASLYVGVVGPQQSSAGAVTLQVARGTQLTHQQLLADAMIMRSRLAAIHDSRARVSVHGDSVVVTGGPKELAEPKSPLTASPALLVRGVLCFSGPYNGSPISESAPALPQSCNGTSYAIEPATPNPTVNGYSSSIPEHDPILAHYPSTTPADDAAHPARAALLPLAGTNKVRVLVGPTQLKLTSSVALARAEKERFGNWVVEIKLSSKSAVQWDALAFHFFHYILGVDLNGRIVSDPVIEPTQSQYTSFDSKMELSGFQSKVSAEDVAAALQSGPLPIPLHIG